MSEATHRHPTLSPYGQSTPRTLPAAGVWFFGGVVAAGLGLGTLTVPVLLLWITSPYPDSGAGGALHIAADLWLLAHGADLLRTDTHSAALIPVALTPLLLSALPAWLLYRALRQAFALHEEQRVLPGDDRGTLSAVGWLGGGYLLAGSAAVLYACDGPVRVDVVSAAVALPVFVGCVGGVAGWAEHHARARHAAQEAAARGAEAPGGAGRPPSAAHPAPPPPLPIALLPESVREGLAPRHLLPALRAAGVATAVLCAGGLLLATGALLHHGDRVLASFSELTGVWSGRFAVLLLAVLLLPNAAVWGSSYVLGPGFSVGAGSGVAPLSGAAGYPHLPPFPLLAALPGQGANGWAAWACAAAVPLAAGVAGGVCVGRLAAPVPGRREGARPWRQTAYVAALAAGACGVAVAVLAAVAGGALGTGTLSGFGPTWWLTGAAATAWTVVLGPPVALAVRAWRLAEPARIGLDEAGLARARAETARDVDEDAWHTADGRERRWAALRSASGGLMPDFAPSERDRSASGERERSA